MTDTESGIPGRETRHVFALGNDQMLVITSADRSDPEWFNGWYDTWRAYLGREGEPMEWIGQVSVKATRDGSEIGTSIGRVYAPSPFGAGGRPTLNGNPIEALKVADWDVTEYEGGTATAVRRQQNGAPA